MERLNFVNDSLETVSNQKELAIDEFIKAFNKIEETISEIKEKENLIDMRTVGDGDLEQDSIEQINEDIIAIYTLLFENKKILADAEERLRETKINTDEFERMIRRLREQLEKKETEIDYMKEQLAARNIDIEHLNKEIAKLHNTVNSLEDDVKTLITENKERKIIIEEKIITINTAFYIVGKKKDLLKKGVIEKKGFIGKACKLKKNFNRKLFTEVDIRELNIIEFSSKEVKIITSHPQSSFNIEKEGKKFTGLSIKNTEDFWSVSKYLVVIIK
jgi:chromosome segregation ATPase